MRAGEDPKKSTNPFDQKSSNPFDQKNTNPFDRLRQNSDPTQPWPATGR